MARIKLSDMSAVEARAHYDRLVWKRRIRAAQKVGYARQAPASIRKSLVAAAQREYRKAQDWSEPQGWHKDRALKLREQYNVGVAAAFLAAHGWGFYDAYKVLFGE